MGIPSVVSLYIPLLIGEDNSSISRSGELLILGCDECKGSLYRVREYLDSVASYPDIFNHNHQKKCLNTLEGK